jgi:hypothetical protein
MLLCSCLLQGSLVTRGKGGRGIKKQHWTETVLAHEGNSQVEL